MEDVLEIYHMPYDPDYPVVCMDESCKQMIGEVREPIPCTFGHPVRIDDEYVRNGVAEIFMEVEPLAGKRHVAVTEHRTRKDWAMQIKQMLDERYSGAIKVRLVIRDKSIRNLEANKHHPVQSSWAADKLPDLKSKRNNSRIRSVPDFYGVPVHRGCHEQIEDRQSQSLGYALDNYYFDGSLKTALQLLHEGHAWAAFASCWHILHVINPLAPAVDAEAKDVLLQAASAAVGQWQPDQAFIDPRQGAAAWWKAVLSFRVAIHYAAHGLKNLALQSLKSGTERFQGRSAPPWVDILYHKARAEVLQDLDEAHIVASETPTISRRQFEAALRLHRGLPAENHFGAIDESLANAESSFWHFRARQEHFIGILNLVRREKGTGIY
ncbi:MAG TPA: hypothetical protein VJZ49_08460 [Syntrophales bacterium]|nr:hypothetical protein [Syntrophales bacterium]